MVKARAVKSVPLHLIYGQSWACPCIPALPATFGHLLLNKSCSGPASADDGVSVTEPNLFCQAALVRNADLVPALSNDFLCCGNCCPDTDLEMQRSLQTSLQEQNRLCNVLMALSVLSCYTPTKVTAVGKHGCDILWKRRNPGPKYQQKKSHWGQWDCSTTGHPKEPLPPEAGHIRK